MPPRQGPRAKQLKCLAGFSATPIIVILLYVLGRPAYFALVGQSFGSSGLAVVQPAAGANDAAVVTNAGVQSPTAPDVAEGGVQLSAEEKSHHLTPEFVKMHAKDNVVMVTWANFHYYDFVMNWVSHLRNLNMTNFVVGAMDDDLLHKLLEQGVPTFAMRSGLTTGDFGWGSKTFHKMGREKINLIRVFVTMGYDIMVSDVDTVWMRDPLEYVQRYPEADILASSDHLSTTVEDDGLEHFAQAHSPANIGILFVRKAGLELVEEWNSMLEADENYWDQNAFNDLFRRGVGQELPNRLFPAYHGKLKMGLLPVSLFCSGHTFFVQKMHEKLGQGAYVVHATFQFSGTEGKRHRMREAQIWESDEAEYYDPPGGFLSFLPDIPDKFLVGFDSKEGHFDLVNHQIAQIRDAMALAQALNRTLVLPRMVCGWDRWWAPHMGTIPHSSLQNPYVCPADHVFDLEQWMRKRSVEEFGPDIPFREYSVLSNPRMLEAVKASKVTVDVCVGSTASCEGEGTSLVKLREAVTDAAAVEMFRPLRDVKVLEFSSMLGVFRGWADEADKNKFHRRIKEYASIWCCIAAHPGHIWYDMLWDQPHTDRHGRVFNETWVPLCGP